MPVLISDEILRSAGLTEREAKIETACRLFDAQKLHLWPAAQLAGLSRGEFEDELLARGLPVYRYTAEHLAQDLEALKLMDEWERPK